MTTQSKYTATEWSDPAWAVRIEAEDEESADQVDEAWSLRETEDFEPLGDGHSIGLTSRANLHRILDWILDEGGDVEFNLSHGATITMEN